MKLAKSRRHCQFCEKITTWIYNPTLAHSRCKECGGAYSINPENLEKRNDKSKNAKR